MYHAFSSAQASSLIAPLGRASYSRAIDIYDYQDGALPKLCLHTCSNAEALSCPTKGPSVGRAFILLHA